MARQMISILSTCLITPLGLGTAETFEAVEAGISGLRMAHGLPENELAGRYSIFSQKQWDLLDADLPDESDFTRFETLLLAAAKGAIGEANINHKSAKTLFVVASEFGNNAVAGVTRFSEQRSSLEYSATSLCQYFENSTPPVVVSCGALSGLQAIIRGEEELESGLYDHVIIVVADVVSTCMMSHASGYNDNISSSYHYIDLDKVGFNRGEAAAAIILSRHNGRGINLSVGRLTHSENVDVFSDIVSSRPLTVIDKALRLSQLTATEVDVVVHGADFATANNELVISELANAGIIGKPTLCFSGYFGHTMGVSGILDIGLGIQMLTNNTLVESLDFQDNGTPNQVAVQAEEEPERLKVCLKVELDSAGAGVAFVLSRN